MEIILTRKMVWKIYNSLRSTEEEERVKINIRRTSKEEKERIEKWLSETEEARDFFGNLIDQMQISRIDTVKIVL